MWALAAGLETAALQAHTKELSAQVLRPQDTEVAQLNAFPMYRSVEVDTRAVHFDMVDKGHASTGTWGEALPIESEEKSKIIKRGILDQSTARQVGRDFHNRC